MNYEKTFVAHSEDSFFDIIDSFAFNLENKHIHCCFSLSSNESFKLKSIKKGFKRGIKEISFTNGIILNSNNFNQNKTMID